MNRARAGLVALGLFVLLSTALAFAGGSAAPHASARTMPLVEGIVVDADHSARASVRCLASDGAKIELADLMQPFGARPLSSRVFATVARYDGSATCVAEDGGRAAWRVRPIQIRAVTLAAPEGAGHAVITIDGQALGPRVASDDGVYLVVGGTLMMANVACREASWSDARVVACASLDRLRDGGVRVRVQAAGRIEEASGAPLALPRTSAH